MHSRYEVYRCEKQVYEKQVYGDIRKMRKKLCWKPLRTKRFKKQEASSRAKSKREGFRLTPLVRLLSYAKNMKSMGPLPMLAKVYLCYIIFLSGLCKLTPKWGEDVYAAMDETFRDRFTPFWEQIFFLSTIGVELNATIVKCAFGSLEVLSAIMLFTPFKCFASIVLFGMMSAVVLTHFFLGEFWSLPMPLFLSITSLGVSFV